MSNAAKSVSQIGNLPKFKAVIQYSGTRYHGWQIQKRGRTVQGVISETLTRLAGRPIAVVGASRTDAGVHALGQVAHFHFPVRDSIPDLRRTLNALLPWDIRIRSLRPASRHFHARKDAIRKRYAYWIYTGDVLPPFLYWRCLHSPGLKGFESMAEASLQFVGTHDFSSFAASSTQVKYKVRTVFRSALVRKGNLWVYRVEADGFLHHMVRNIVGTLLEIGKGKLDQTRIAEILEARDRSRAGPTARAEGLVLTRIWYRKKKSQVPRTKSQTFGSSKA